MLAALVLGVPVGALASGVALAIHHPAVFQAVTTHPALLLPAAGIGAVGTAIWAAASMLGAGLPGATLHAWVVAAAACLYAWFDRRHARARSLR